MKYLFFDTETTGVIKKKLPLTDPSQPRMVSLAAVLLDDTGPIHTLRSIVRPDGFEIPTEASAIHGITTERAMDVGISVRMVFNMFNHLCYLADRHVAFNYKFDSQIVQLEAMHYDNKPHYLTADKGRCCMLPFENEMKLPGLYGKWKWPSLDEVCAYLGIQRDGAHDALGDVMTTIQCWFTGVRAGIIKDC